MLNREQIIERLELLLQEAKGTPIPVPSPAHIGFALDDKGRTVFDTQTGFIACGGDSGRTLDEAIALLNPSRRHIVLKSDQVMLGRYEQQTDDPRYPYVIFGNGHSINGFRIDRRPAAGLGLIDCYLDQPILRVPSRNILMEGCHIFGGEAQVRPETHPGGKIENFRLRLCTIENAYPNRQNQGFYMYGVHDWSIEGSIFKGTYDRVTMSVGELERSQLLYVQEPSSPGTVELCIFTGAAGHGSQMRSGGILRRCLYHDNPVAHQHGYGRDGKDAWQSSGVIEDILVMNGRDIKDSIGRSWGIVAEDVSQLLIQRVKFHTATVRNTSAPVVILRGAGTLGTVEIYDCRATGWVGGVHDRQSGAGTVIQGANNWDAFDPKPSFTIPDRFSTMAEAKTFFDSIL